MSLNPRETLDTMLGLLGFVCEIKEFEHEHGLTLQVYTAEKDRLIGRNGALLEDIQTLLNRLLQAKDKGAPKVQVDITSAPVQAGDVFLLCSDGLWGQVSDPDIGDIVKSEPDSEIASRRMVDLANAHGGPDNISVLLVRVERVDRASWVRAAARAVWRALAKYSLLTRSSV